MLMNVEHLAQCLLGSGSLVMDVAIVVAVKHQDDVHPGTSQATAGGVEREYFPGHSLCSKMLKARRLGLAA